MDVYDPDQHPEVCAAGNRLCAQAPEFAEILGHSGAAHTVIGALVRGGIVTMDQIRMADDEELLAVEGVGRNTINRLRAERPFIRKAAAGGLDVTGLTALTFAGLDSWPQPEKWTVAVLDGTEVTLHGSFSSDGAATAWANEKVGHDNWAVAGLSRARPARQGRKRA